MSDILKRTISFIALTIGVILAILILIFVVDSSVEIFSKSYHYNCSNEDSSIVVSNSTNGVTDFNKEHKNRIVTTYPNAAELKDINPYDTLYSSGNSYEDLKRTIIINNMSCPVFIGEGMAVSFIKEEEGWITHYCVVDEDIWNLRGMSQDVQTIASMRAAMKDYIVSSSANDNLYRNTLKLYVNNDKGIKYHYYGTKSHSSFDIKYSASELNEIIELTNPL